MKLKNETKQNKKFELVAWLKKNMALLVHKKRSFQYI